MFFPLVYSRSGSFFYDRTGPANKRWLDDHLFGVVLVLRNRGLRSVGRETLSDQGLAQCRSSNPELLRDLALAEPLRE